MAREPSAAILDPLRRLITRQTGSSLPDAQLLENFVARRDEASFEVLVWRHGAMVLALCKRVLRDTHEAEDAFQATFLVFARKAGSIAQGEAVACWLYKVAYRIAIRLRTASANRPTATELADELPAPDMPDDAEWRDLRPLLDDEIAKLPEKYRAPFVLCYLEGRTNEEAAVQLGCPKGTVLSRLSRGREWLRDRLARRGVTLTAVVFAFTLTRNAASAALPSALVPVTTNAAIPFAAGKAATELVPANVATLVEGVLRAMTFTYLKTAAVALLSLVVLGSGITWAAFGTANSPAPGEPVALVAPESRAAATEGDRDRERPAPAAMTGKVVAVAKDGKSFTVETPPAARGEEPGKAVVKLGEKATATYNGVGTNGAKLTEGYIAQVWLQDGSKDVATSVSFNGPEPAGRGGDVSGVVASIAKDGKSVEISLVGVRGERGERGAEPKKVTIPFDLKTILSFSNVAKDGATLAAGQRITVWYADDGKTAAKVQLVGAMGEEGRRDAKRPDMLGKVTRVSDDGKSITVEVPPKERGGEATQMTVKIGDKATTAFHNVPTDGAKAAAGMQAQVWLADGEKETAAKVAFVGTVPERWVVVAGKVVAVAKDGSSITVEQPSTVRGEEPKRTEIKLNAKTKVAYFGVGAGEAKPAEGLMASVRLLDGSTDTAAQVTFGKVSERGR